MLVEGVETFLDGVNVIINASGGLSTLEETFSHGLVADLEIEDLGARTDFFFELFSLSNFTRVSEKD